MNHSEAMDYIAANRRGVLATIKRDGRAQLSHVDYTLDDDGQIKIQVVQDYAKTRNVRRDPRVSLSVIGDDWGQYVVAEGRACLVDEEPLAALRHVYQRIAGEPHPDWAEFDQAMLDERQVVMAIEIDRIYPLTE